MKRRLEDRGDGAPPPKRQALSVNDFALHEAEEDGVDVLDGYEDEYGDNDDYDPNLLAKGNEQLTHMTEYQKLLNQQNSQDDRLAQLTEKYGRWSEFEQQAENEGAVMSLAAHEIGEQNFANDYEGETEDNSALMPTLRDPKLWMVPCKYGFERQAVVKLIAKWAKTAHRKDKRLHILSAFTTDQNIGLIYVEAYQEIHVKTAVEGIEGLNMWKIKIVFTKDMPACLAVKMKVPTVNRGQWIRMKQGLYKEDLAQVWDVRDQGAKVIAKVVPRIDYSTVAHPGSSSAGRFGRYAQVPAQKPFNYNEIRSLGGDVEERRDRYLDRTIHMFKGHTYYKGFLLKIVDVDKVQFDVTATREEVAPFRRNLDSTGDDEEEDAAEEELWKVPLPTMKRNVEFKRDDTVKVTSGALKNLTGKVLTTTVNADGKTIVAMMPNYDGLNEPLDFEAETLKKFFSVGSQVKVLHGTYKGETGLIVKVDEQEDQVVIFSDMTSKEIEALADDIIETTEVSSGRDTFGRFKLHDLVQLSNERVGVIVQIQTGQFTVLDNKSDLQTVRIHEIVRNLNDKHTVALDRNGDQLQVSDVVLPVTGPWRGERCTVKHVYRITLFLHNRQCMENSGVFALPARQSVMAGNKQMKRNERSSNTIRLNGSNLLTGTRSKKKDPWINATVKITKGSWKGYLGIVKNTTDRHLQVELHAKSKTVNIRRQHVKKTDRQGSSIEGSHTPGSTPGGFGGRTPKLLGSQTPRYGGLGNATPFLGSQTPMHGGATPMYGGMTPRIGHETPRYGGDTPGYGGATPGYGGTTPGYGGATPAYGGTTPGFGGATPAYAQTPAYETPKYDGSATPNLGNATPAYGDTIGTPHYGDSQPFPASNPGSAYGDSISASSPYTTSGGPNTPVTTSNNMTSPDNNYQPLLTNQENMFTPSGPHTPQQAYDPSDMSDAQETKPFSPVTNFGDDYNSFSETGEDLSTSDIGVSDPRNSDSMTHTDSGNENPANLNPPEDPFYFVVLGAELKYNDGAAVVQELVGTDQVRISVNGQDITVTKDALTYALPKEGDNVKVVHGAVTGEEGELLGIDGEDAIVKMSATFEIQILPRDSMVKIPASAAS